MSWSKFYVSLPCFPKCDQLLWIGFKEHSKKNKNFRYFWPPCSWKLQDLAIKNLYQWTISLRKVINSNFYIDISFCDVKKDRHNLINLSHFLCNFRSFDMVCVKHTEKEMKGNINTKI